MVKDSSTDSAVAKKGDCKQQGGQGHTDCNHRVLAGEGQAPQQCRLISVGVGPPVASRLSVWCPQFMAALAALPGQQAAAAAAAVAVAQMPAHTHLQSGGLPG